MNRFVRLFVLVFNILTRKFDLRLQLRFFTQTELKNRSNKLIKTTIDEHQYTPCLAASSPNLLV